MSAAAQGKPRAKNWKELSSCFLRAGLVRVGGGARMTGAARPVHFASRNARQPDMRPLGAPDRAIAIPYGGRSAVARLARRDARGEEMRCGYQDATIPSIPRSCKRGGYRPPNQKPPPTPDTTLKEHRKNVV